MNIEEIIENLDARRYGSQDKIIYEIIEKNFENKEIEINEFVNFYEKIESDFENSLKSALDKYIKNHKVFLNAYDKNENKIYVGDNIIYYRRKRSLHPAELPEFEGEVHHGIDEDGNKLYYYTDKIIKLKGEINYGIDKYGYHSSDYVTLKVNGGYQPTKHYIEKTIKLGKKPNGRYIYDYRKIYTDIEVLEKDN